MEKEWEAQDKMQEETAVKESGEQEGFSYTYSAKEQEELKRIRQKYQPREENKMDALRKLDAGVTRKATSVSIALGVVGALGLGMGMSLTMTDLNVIFAMTHRSAMILGIIVGMVGIVLVCMAYPVYNKILKKEREKIAPQILRLTEELMK